MADDNRADRRDAELEPLAQAALAAYELPPLRLELLSAHQNAIFAVVTPGGQRLYALRLHGRGAAGFAHVPASAEAVSAELAWMVALGEQARVLVPKPARTRAGSLSTEIAVPGGTPVVCSLVAWIEGQPLDARAAGAAALMEPFAQAVADLHEQAAQWTPPTPWPRPEYGAEHLADIMVRVLKAVRLGLVTAQEAGVLAATASAIGTAISTARRQPGEWHAIHADLHPGNCIVADGQIALVDFGLCGTGPRLFDVAGAYASFPRPLRPGFLDAYRARRALPANFERLASACALYCMFGYMAFVVDHPVDQAWLPRRVPQVVEENCRPFLAGESILEALR